MWHLANNSFGQFAAASSPEALAVLKQQLRQTLARVEAQERVLNESLRPQTVEEAAALEEKLAAALEDVRARRAELQRAGGEGKQQEGGEGTK